VQICVEIKAIFHNLSSVEEDACDGTLNYTATTYYQHRNSAAYRVTPAQSRHIQISELFPTGIGSKLTGYKRRKI
jgi:hypothetical protein